MNGKTKIAYLDYSPHYAGAERALSTIISNLDKEKYEPIIVVPFMRPHLDRYADLGCRIVPLASGLKWWMGSLRWKHPLRGTDFLYRGIMGHLLRRFLKSENINILHVNLLRPDCSGWLKPSFKAGIKILGHFRSLPMDWVPSASIQNMCADIVCVSNIVEEHLVSKSGYRRSHVIYDSVTLRDVRSGKDYSNNGRPFIASVAALFPNKGHDNAIKAFSLVAYKLPDLDLLIAGGGGSSDELKRLEAIAQECGIAERVFFTRGQVSDIGEIYHQAKLILSLTKEGEAFGLVPYEAALCGTPCIAPDRGAVKEILKDGESIILADTLSVESIAKKIEWALRHPNECNSISEKARNITLNRLSPQKMISQLAEIYSRYNN